VIGYTQAEIGVMFGYSQARISQILKTICVK
jgi:DNA-directed RNA polymerase specialized sigma subunit